MRTRTYTHEELEEMADLVDQAIAAACAEFYVRGAMAAFIGDVTSGMSNAELIAAGRGAVSEHRTVNPRILERMRDAA